MFKTVVTPPPAPMPRGPISGGLFEGHSVPFKWSKVATATTYLLQVAVDSFLTSIVFSDSVVSDTARTVELTPGGTYYSAGVRQECRWKRSILVGLVYLYDARGSAGNQP